MTAQMIRRFAITGDFIETKMIQTQGTVRSLIINMMRDDGYVPLMDVSPVWQTSYEGGERYTFTYTMQGIWVGKDKAWQIDGMMDGKLIPSSPRNK